MSIESAIVNKLYESKHILDERTYTIGDTQYWKRNGKCYSWTQESGRKEISEDEYLKIIASGSEDSILKKNISTDDLLRVDDDPLGWVNKWLPYNKFDEYEDLMTKELETKVKDSGIDDDEHLVEYMANEFPQSTEDGDRIYQIFTNGVAVFNVYGKDDISVRVIALDRDEIEEYTGVPL